MRLNELVLFVAAIVTTACTSDPDPAVGGPRGEGPKGDAPAGTCVDACGGQSRDACWCDDQCAAFGDCCADKQAVCDGAALGPEVRLSTDPSFTHGSFTYARTVVAAGQTVHSVYYEERGVVPGGDPLRFRDVFYRRSRDLGATWDPEVRLTNAPEESQFPCVAVAGAVVHVVWSELRDGNPEIYYKRSLDGGTSWGADVRLTSDGANSFAPSLVASGSIVHVVWYDQRPGNYEVYYKRSSDAGSTWSADTRLTFEAADSVFPSIAVTGADVHLAWLDSRDGNRETYTKRSTNAGVSWGADTRLTFDGTEGPAHPATRAPSIAVSDARVHVAWSEERDGNQEIYVKRSTDRGVTWAREQRLTNSLGASGGPSIAMAGTVVDVVWSDDRDGSAAHESEIYRKHSDDGGVTWSADERLTFHDFSQRLSYGLHPTVFVAGASAHLMWTDSRDRSPDGTGPNYDVYYRRLR